MSKGSSGSIRTDRSRNSDAGRGPSGRITGVNRGTKTRYHRHGSRGNNPREKRKGDGNRHRKREREREKREKRSKERTRPEVDHTRTEKHTHTHTHTQRRMYTHGGNVTETIQVHIVMQRYPSYGIIVQSATAAHDTSAIMLSSTKSTYPRKPCSICTAGVANVCTYVDGHASHVCVYIFVSTPRPSHLLTCALLRVRDLNLCACVNLQRWNDVSRTSRIFLSQNFIIF